MKVIPRIKGGIGNQLFIFAAAVKFMVKVSPKMFLMKKVNYTVLALIV